MIGNYWNSAWRNLMKRKRFSFINIFGLAVGMASALLILTYVTFEFSFDKMHTKYDHIYRVQSTFHEGDVLTDYWASSSFGYGSAMKENLAGIEDYTRIGSLFQPEQIRIVFHKSMFQKFFQCFFGKPFDIHCVPRNKVA